MSPPNQNSGRRVPLMASHQGTPPTNMGVNAGDLDASAKFQAEVDWWVEEICAGRVLGWGIMDAAWNPKENRPVTSEKVREIKIKDLEANINYYRQRQNQRELSALQREVARKVVPIFIQMLNYLRSAPQEVEFEPEVITPRKAVKRRDATKAPAKAANAPADMVVPKIAALTDAKEQERARDLIEQGLRERIANDPRIQQIKEWRQAASLAADRLRQQIDRAKNRPGTRTPGELKKIADDLKRGVVEKLSLERRIAVHRDTIERELHVSDTFWRDDANRLLTHIEALDLELELRLEATEKKYAATGGEGLAPEETDLDRGELLGVERTRQLLGAATENDANPHLQRVLSMLDEIGMRQEMLRVKKLQSRMDHDATGVQDKEIQQEISSAVGRSRRRLVFGSAEGEDVLVARLLEEIAKLVEMRDKRAGQR